MTTEEMRIVTLEDENLSALAELVLHVCPSTKAEIHNELQPYWSFREEKAIIDGIAIKGRMIIIHALLQDKALRQL